MNKKRFNEGGGMMKVIIVILLAYSLMKWFLWKINFEAILLYYSESGLELPEPEIIREYRVKVVEKHLCIK